MLKNYKLYFQYMSYLQYPLMIIATYFAYEPLLFEIDTYFESINKSLLFMGLAISFSSLQDTTKTQNKLSRIVYQNPIYAKTFIIYVMILTFVLLSFGIYGFLFSTNDLQGMAAMRANYKDVFDNSPNLNAELISRMVFRNKVIDREIITNRKEVKYKELVVIYEVEDGLIASVRYIS